MSKPTMVPFLDFAEENQFISFKQRTNVNGYPYVTFLFPDPENPDESLATNIYVAATNSEEFLARLEAGEKLEDFIYDMSFIDTISNQPGHEGELRTKLCFGESTYATIDFSKKAVKVEEPVTV